jgi:GcrA cell cycle regulator
MELRENMCRWPMGDPTTPEFRFCGMKTDTGQPYCSYHCRIAYQPAGERRRERDEQRRIQQRA